MNEDLRERVSATLAELEVGARTVFPDDLLPGVYAELRRIAGRFLAGERPGHTLQPTALVHEAYLKLVDQTRVDWRGRSHFVAVAAQAMRRILIDHARGRAREKRGGDMQRVTLADALSPALSGNELGPEELLAVERALAGLESLDPRQAKVVEYKIFGGLKTAEIAQLLGVSTRTVEGDWTHARAWLRRELSAGGAP